MSGGGASLVEAEVGSMAWCLGVAGSAWEWLEVPGSGWEWPGWPGWPPWQLGGSPSAGGTCAAWRTAAWAGRWGPGLGEREGQWGVLEGVLGRQGVWEWRLGVGWWSRGMEGG